MKILKNKKSILGLISIFLFALIFFLSYKPIPLGKALKQETFSRLKDIREERKKRILDYFSLAQEKAKSIKNDIIMKNFFESQYNNKVAQKERDLIEIDRNFVKNYNLFYDILFIDQEGFVFHTIKRESDYHKNIFELTNTKWANALLKKEELFFTDYEYYDPSEEPAAFFIVPVKKDGQFIGWFVLQAAINQINKIAQNYEDLGRTGEVYLVNSNEEMLTDSRFFEESTILKMKIETTAVKDAFNFGSGEKIITDYRGINVFSSYEKFEIYGAVWAIVAEIDEDEILSDFYLKHKSYFIAKISEYMSKKDYRTDKNINLTAKLKKVDLNEYIKAKPGDVLYTLGVSTCTSIVVSFPEKFGYLAHITPVDSIYVSNFLSNLFLGDKKTNMFSRLLTRIKYHNIHPYEQKDLKFYIIATHNESFEKAVDKIISYGSEISSIHFLYKPNYESVNIFYDISENYIMVKWNTDIQNSKTEDASLSLNLALVIKEIIGYENDNAI
ncbi:MAG: cache domain-containing protein [Spirochaetia bacterium]|nr:cache domain-containing protein [Spirochaetia bacterium]